MNNSPYGRDKRPDQPKITADSAGRWSYAPSKSLVRNMQAYKTCKALNNGRTEIVQRGFMAGEKA